MINNFLLDSHRVQVSRVHNNILAYKLQADNQNQKLQPKHPLHKQNLDLYKAELRPRIFWPIRIMVRDDLY